MTTCLSRLIGLTLFSVAMPIHSQEPKLISSVSPDLVIPELSEGSPGPGIRARALHPNWSGGNIYHTLYLPTDWNAQQGWPVIIELPGNGNFRNQWGDVSTGLPEGCQLGYGLSRGRGSIWCSLPFLDGEGENIAIQWWGDKPNYDPGATIRYIKEMVPWICKQYNGDPERVLLAGFSRGAIACNYIGLYDDEIAGLWAGMFAYSHYDGVKRWPYPGSDRAAAAKRIKRLGQRPQFICHEGEGVNGTKHYLDRSGFSGAFTFSPTGFINHNAGWLLRPSPARDKAYKWFERLMEQ